MKKLIRSALVILTLAVAISTPQIASARGGKIQPTEGDCVSWSTGGGCRLYISCRDWADERVVECAWIKGGGEIMWSEDFAY